MEGIIIMAVLFFFLQSLGKRAKEVQQKRQEYYAQNASANGQASPQVKAVQAPKKPEQTPLKHNSATEGMANYQLVTPSIQLSNLWEPYVGSLSTPTVGGTSPAPATGEGSASAEGMDTCEPSLAHDRATPFEPYGLGNADAPFMDILPPQWDSTTLVRAVVMNEVLNRPRGWRREHG